MIFQDNVIGTTNIGTRRLKHQRTHPPSNWNKLITDASRMDKKGLPQIVMSIRQ